MKLRYASATRLLLILVFVCVISNGSTAAQSGGRLIVLRSPTFGWNIVLYLKIDGRTIAAVPNSYYSYPTSTVLNVRPGQTYVFTGSWDGSNRVVLIPSALPPG